MKIATLSIGLITVAVLFAGCGLAQNNIEDSKLSGGVNSAEVQQDSSDSWTGTMAEALALGKGMRCDWSTNDVTSTGIIKGEKVYSETEIADKKTYMVMKENCTWIWEEGSTEGMKMCAEEDLVEGAEDDFVDYQDFDSASYQMDTYVDCELESVSNSQFDIPESIFFIDPYEAFMHDMQSADVYGL